MFDLNMSWHLPYLTSILSFTLASLHLSGQEVATFPKLYPSNISQFTQEDGMPITCAWNGINDRKGRLWINPCFGQAEHQTVNFYQFNCRRADEIHWTNQPMGATGQACLAGMQESGELYGFFRKSNHFFRFNPDSRKTHFFKLDREQAEIVFMGYTPKHGLIVLAGYANRQLIYQLKEDKLNLLLDYESSIDHDLEAEKDRFFPNFQLLAGDELWFCEARDLVFSGNLRERLKILRFNLQNQSLRPYTFDELFAGSLPPPLLFRYRVNLVEGPQGSILLADRDHVYQIDTLTGRALLRWVFPHRMDHISYIFNYQITRDLVGNLLFMFPDKRNNYIGVLMDTSSRLFDYSAVLEATVKASRFENILHYNVFSRDFRRNILAFQQGGIIAADLKYYGAITSVLKGSATRGIVEWKPGEYLVKPEDGDHFVFAGLQNFFSQIPEQSGNQSNRALLQPVAMSKLVAKGGYWWYSNGENLVRLDSNLKPHAFLVGSYFAKFTFLDSRTIALYTEKHGLCFLDLTTQKLSLWQGTKLPNLSPNDVNALYLARDSSLWIVTLNGLWQLELNTGTGRRYGYAQGFRDERAMCLHEDEAGRLWVGMYAGGLHIFDPQSGKIQVIDREGGLSNNTVVGILSDNQGVQWVATYNGLNLISTEGEVLAQLYEEDGLSTNEFNRFSFCKDSKGQLLFGSVKGVNIIQPEVLKKQLQLSDKLHIYLTGITRYDSHKGGDSTLHFGFDQMGVLFLPAARRYLNLSFSLSSHIRTEDHSFAYKIVKENDPDASEWIYIANKSQLDLPNLPSGRYQIRIRGYDHRGICTPEPLQIEVDIAEFFYNTWWFYVLCALPFLLGAYFWIRRLQLEREHLEVEVNARTEQIRHDKELIEQQAAKLKTLDEIKSRFFTNISHEFRTPLTVISGMATQIRQQPGQWLENGMELIQRNSQQLLSLINQILDLRKLESGALTINLIRSNIIPYLRYIAESFVQLAHHKGLRMHILAKDDTIDMDYDPEKMMHILSNLLSNAIKYTPPPGDIYLQIDLQHSETGREQLLVQVKDSGEGISTEALPHIFELFYQVEDLATQKPQGSGVGLALTKELVQLLNGRIEVSSKPGEGTTFSLTFPITREARIQEGHYIPSVEIVANSSVSPEIEIMPAADVTPSTSFGTRKIGYDKPSLLIVEDNADVRLYISSFLDPHYHLLLAKDGQEGIELAIEEVPDLIVSDVMMPVKDGFALCETLKNDERTSHIPIVLLTAKADFESRLSGLRRGADAYLSKPFEQEELLVRLEQLLALRAKLQARYRNPSFAESPADSEAVQAEDTFILKLRQLVLDHLAEEDYGIVHLCRAIALGRTQLHNKIKALTGQSTSEFIRTVRLNKARELLQTTDLNVSEVSYEVGISNPAYFSRIYSEEFGEAPRETRR
ncbi:MAG: response regulator [Saprospiraceae bacterium]|nr:response regulator [Saprospiraceae bacterium]